MANEKVSQMVSLTAAQVALEDLFMIVDSSAKESKRISVDEVLTFIEATGSFHAVTALLANTASYVAGGNVDGTVLSASFANNSVTASYAIKTTNADSASVAKTASFISPSLTSVATASFLLYSGFANGTASFALTASSVLLSKSSSFLIYAGIPNGTASYALSAASASSAIIALSSSVTISSSYSVTSSYANTSTSSSYSLTSSFSTFKFGPSFISPVTVYTSVSATPFTSFDASPYVPIGTQVVILDAKATNGNTNAPAFIYIRKDVSSPSLILISYESGGGGDVCSYGGQGCFPIATDLSFQYSATQPSDGGIQIRLVGYY